MRKQLNKKGFSLVELMIVVVIMGILIAVAIPLYGAITDNANNKTCATNIKTIKGNAANFYASHEQATMSSLADMKAMFDDGKIPQCPVAKEDYVIAIQPTGAAKVWCPATPKGTVTDGKFTPTDAGDAHAFHDPLKTGAEIGNVPTTGVLGA